MPNVPSTRWCPTPEQLRILEEMYRSGIRTPSAVQIQQITAHLSCYGKIEGKNVFYWFQNHKARDRQRMRRRLGRHQQQHNPPTDPQIFQTQLPHPSAVHPHQFLHQEGGYQATTSSVANPVMDLVCKLETCEKEGDMERWRTTTAATTSGSERTTTPATTTSLPPCCSPLKTLDLFPTNSTRLKDEFCCASKSSSCSASTTN